MGKKARRLKQEDRAVAGELKPQYRAFANAYVLNGFNGTKAAIAAGYSPKTAYSQANRLLENADILAEVERVFRENTMSAGEVLYHLTQIARSDFAHLVDRFGDLDLDKAASLGKTNLIKKVKRKTVVTADKDGEGSDILESEVEGYDRLKALELLAKYHDLINKVRVEDWRTEAIADIRAGRVTYDALVQAFDRSLAAELFAQAGVPVAESVER